MTSHSPSNVRNGFSLVEALIALFIVASLTALIIPAIGQMRERSNQVTCRNNLKNLALSVHADKGKMPPYATGKMNEIYGGWYVHLLRLEGYESVYDTLANGQRAEHKGLRTATDGRYLPGVYGIPFPQLICPSDPSRSIESHDSLTNYLANWFAFTDDHRSFYRPAQRFNQISDGLSNTVLFAEGYSHCDDLPRLALYSAVFHNFGVTQSGLPSDAESLAPKDYTMFQVQPSGCDKLRSQTPHAVMNVALADGSVRAVSPAISLETWKAVLKPRDGIELGTDW